MKKLFLLTKTLLVTALLGLGASEAWGDDYTTVWSQSFSSEGSGVPSGWSLSSTSGVKITYPTIATHVAWNMLMSSDRTMSMSLSSNTTFTDALAYTFEFYWNTSAAYGGGTTTMVVTADNNEKVLFSTSAPTGNKSTATSTVYKADGTTSITTLSHTNFADLTTLYKFTVEGTDGGMYLTIDNIASDGTSTNTLARTLIYDTFCHITGFSGSLPRYYNRYAFADLSLSYNTTSMASIESTLLSTYNSIKSEVMNSTIYSALESAATSENLSPAELNSTTVSAWNTALCNLETAITNAQNSINNFIVLNDLIAKANTFAETYTSYEAPSGAETVYTANADVDPETLAASVRAAVITAGTVSENSDLTAIIANNSFELGNTLGWTIVASDDTGARSVGESGSTYYSSGADGDYLFNTWSQGTPIKQTIGTLPAGQYTLACKVSSNGATVFLTMNSDHNEGVTTSDGTVFIDDTYTFTLASETEVTIGAVGGAGDGSFLAEGHWWYKADCFTFTYDGQDPLAQAQASLEDEITTATTLKDSWTAKVGTAPFKYDATYYNALVSQITTATAVLNGGSETVSDYTTAETDLETAETNMESSTINQPSADAYYRLYLADTELNLNLLQGPNLSITISSTPAAVKIVPVSNGYNIRDVYGNNLVYLKNNSYTWCCGASNVETRGERFTAAVQDDGTVIFTSAYASLVLSASNSDGGNAGRGYSSTKWEVSDAVDVTEVSLAVNATADWGTFIAPYDNLTPSTVKAYTVSHKSGNSISFVENTTGVLSANTPYILYTEEDDNVSKTLIGVANNDKASYSSSGLVGLISAATIPTGSYVMQYQAGEGTAFYKTAEEITGLANRCYIVLNDVPTEAEGARTYVTFQFYGDEENETTGVDKVEGFDTNAKTFYNLNGQRVAQPAKGLYIVNGKKVIIK